MLRKNKCPECESSAIKILDGEQVCTNCGYVMISRLWETGLEKYESEQGLEIDQQQLATWIDE